LKFNSSLNNLLSSLGINQAVGKLVTVIVSVVFVVHLIACIWYWVADFGDF